MSSTPPSPEPSAEQPAPQCYRHPGRETWIRCQRCERPICPDCMIAASVGFQCPECVKRGAKETRSGRAAYGGNRSADPRQTTFALIAANVLVWLLLVGSGRDQLAGKLLPLLPGGRCDTTDGTGRYFPSITDATTCAARGGDYVAGVADGAAWQVVTSMFAHFDLPHLGFNMLALFFLGPMLESVLGRVRFLAVYLFSGLTGSALVMLASDPQAQTLGASGAIFGMMGALLVVGFKVGANLQMIGFWLLLNLVFTFTAGRDISWQGHIGGLVGGALAALVIVLAPKQHRAWFQWGALGIATVVVLVVIAARAAML